MAGPSPVRDYTALLQSFLRQNLVLTFHDPQRTPDEQLDARMKFEQFLFMAGPRILEPLQRAFNITEEEQAHQAPAAEWFMEFVSSRSRLWLEEARPDLPERFWRTLQEQQVRRRAVDLILLIEFTGANATRTARFSRLISLFRSSEQEPFDEQITPDGWLLLECVLGHVRLTSPERLAAGGSLGNYCILVARYACVAANGRNDC
jgi:hypothetical protein